jgi:hypothetical protein
MFGRRVRPHIGAQLFAGASALINEVFHSFEAQGVAGQAATGGRVIGDDEGSAECPEEMDSGEPCERAGKVDGRHRLVVGHEVYAGEFDTC